MAKDASFIVLALIVAGCSQPSPSKPKAAITPEAKSVKEPVSEEELAQVREYMWALAGEVRALDEELTFGESNDGDGYAIKSKLERILAISQDLSEDNKSIQHPIIDASLDRFTLEVEAALAANKDGTMFVSAGRVIGACATCHDVHACPFDSYARCVEGVN